ncbi:MAG TPA: hypothetical protein VGW57_17805 [Chthoniobacterales bacterium]|nr:hypothetical protein [Chthoniobacterales bacterium]
MSVRYEEGMPGPEAHYSLELINHETENRLKIELIDLPFPGARSYRIRVNEKWAQKVLVASKKTRGDSRQRRE